MDQSVIVAKNESRERNCASHKHTNQQRHTQEQSHHNHHHHHHSVMIVERESVLLSVAALLLCGLAVFVFVRATRARSHGRRSTHQRRRSMLTEAERLRSAAPPTKLNARTQRPIRSVRIRLPPGKRMLLEKAQRKQKRKQKENLTERNDVHPAESAKPGSGSSIAVSGRGQASQQLQRAARRTELSAGAAPRDASANCSALAPSNYGDAALLDSFRTSLREAASYLYALRPNAPRLSALFIYVGCCSCGVVQSSAGVCVHPTPCASYVRAHAVELLATLSLPLLPVHARVRSP
jgi:hypothetical protein